MALKPVVTALTDVPEAHRPLYEQRDGKYVLALEGDPAGYVKATDLADANGKLIEFRDNNVKLLKALGADSVDGALARAAVVAGIDPAKLAALKDLDPEAAKAALARVAELEKKGVKTGEDVAVQIKAAIDSAMAPVREELANEKKARTEAQSRADEALLRETVGSKYLKAGGKPEAVDFIVAEFKKDFRVVNNAVVALDGRLSPENGVKPLTDQEWLAGATKKFGFAFEPSKGGGANPAGAGNGNGARPGVRQMVNPSPQELGRLKNVPGKGLVDQAGQPVEIVNQ